MRLIRKSYRQSYRRQFALAVVFHIALVSMILVLITPMSLVHLFIFMMSMFSFFIYSEIFIAIEWGDERVK